MSTTPTHTTPAPAAPTPASAATALPLLPVLSEPCKTELEQVAHVPPSVQTVYCALYGHEPMTGRQLRDATNLPRRTIYAALQRLKELRVIQERASLRDTRQTFYWAAGAPQAPPTFEVKRPVPPAGPSNLPDWALKALKH